MINVSSGTCPPSSFLLVSFLQIHWCNRKVLGPAFMAQIINVIISSAHSNFSKISFAKVSFWVLTVWVLTAVYSEQVSSFNISALILWPNISELVTEADEKLLVGKAGSLFKAQYTCFIRVFNVKLNTEEQATPLTFIEIREYFYTPVSIRD